MNENGAGKGDTYRPVNKSKFDAEYNRIFKKSIPTTEEHPKEQPKQQTTGVSSSVFEAFKLAHFGVSEWPELLVKRSSEQLLAEIIARASDTSKRPLVTLDQICDELSNRFLRSRDIPDDIDV